MSFRNSLRPLVLSALLATGAVAVASTNPSASDAHDASAPARVGEGEGDDLEDVMHGIDKNFEAAMVAIEKKDGPAALELMTKLEQGCIGAKILTPPKLRTIEEKDKAAFIAGYRKQILAMLKSVADLEIALVDNDFEKARKVADEIDAMKKAGHDAYKKMPRKKKE